MIRIVPYRSEYGDAFYNLNVEWLETFFYVEEYDREVLRNPEKHILKPGGYIFFAVENQTVLGTVALLKRAYRVYELTKMAVLPSERGRQIGQRLMQHCITFSLESGFHSLILYSNTKLENAIHIYRKYRFREVSLEHDTPYERSNIKMELLLS